MESNLPELIGSEKQVKWASAIRAGAVAALESTLSMAAAQKADGRATEDQIASLGRMITWITARDNAAWWIENRAAIEGFSGKAILRLAVAAGIR